MHIGTDIMGGEFAPNSTMHEATLASNKPYDHTKLVLLVNKEKIQKILTRGEYYPGGLTVLHAGENKNGDIKKELYNE